MTYKRAPFFINHHTVGVIQIFRQDGVESMHDAWLWDLSQHGADPKNMYRDGAKQLVDQLQGEESIIFLVALRDEIEKIILQEEKQARERAAREVPNMIEEEPE